MSAENSPYPDSGFLVSSLISGFKAASLNERFVEKLGTRGVDVLHVGIALCLGKTAIVSFDKRQGRLAESAGLRWLH